MFDMTTENRSITLPKDMWHYFDLIKERDGVPVSTQIRIICETAIMDNAEARTLVDSRVPYTTQEVE